MRPRTVTVYAPASISNLGSGFDVVGLAIDEPGDTVRASRMPERGLSFSLRSGPVAVPSNRHNVAAHVASLMLEEFRPPFGVRMVLHKNMPVGSGLGSSGASSVASAVAVNALLAKPLPKRDLLRFAVEGERKAAGSPHADNVAPSLLGGACVIRSTSPLNVISLPVRDSIVWVVVHPHCEVRTERARAVLPKRILLETAVRQWGNVAGLVAGLIAGDARMVGRCVEDAVAEPARANLVKGFYTVQRAALEAGAHGCSFSGSGPSLFAVASSAGSARKVAAAMVKAFARTAGVESDVFISRINFAGARVIPVRPS